jgi:hypothetical protein
MTEYLIYFHQQWVGDHTERGPRPDDPSLGLRIHARRLLEQVRSRRDWAA